MICTRPQLDHVTVAELGTALDAPVLMHPGAVLARRMSSPGQKLSRRFRLMMRCRGWHGTRSCVRCTPRALPGSVCWYAPRAEQAPCSAETRCSLAGRVQPAADIPTSPRSCGRYPDGSAHYRATPSCTRRHGDSATIGDEIIHYEEWVARGH